MKYKHKHHKKKFIYHDPKKLLKEIIPFVDNKEHIVEPHVLDTIAKDIDGKITHHHKKDDLEQHEDATKEPTTVPPVTYGSHHHHNISPTNIKFNTDLPTNHNWERIDHTTIQGTKVDPRWVFHVEPPLKKPYYSGIPGLNMDHGYKPNSKLAKVKSYLEDPSHPIYTLMIILCGNTRTWIDTQNVHRRTFDFSYYSKDQRSWMYQFFTWHWNQIGFGWTGEFSSPQGGKSYRMKNLCNLYYSKSNMIVAPVDHNAYPGLKRNPGQRIRSDEPNFNFMRPTQTSSDTSTFFKEHEWDTDYIYAKGEASVNYNYSKYYFEVAGPLDVADDKGKKITIRTTLDIRTDKRFYKWWHHIVPHNVSSILNKWEDTTESNYSNLYLNQYIRPSDFYHVKDLINSSFYDQEYFNSGMGLHAYDSLLLDFHMNNQFNYQTTWTYDKVLILPDEIGHGFVLATAASTIQTLIANVNNDIHIPEYLIVLSRIKSTIHSVDHAHDVQKGHLMAEFYEWKTVGTTEGYHRVDAQVLKDENSSYSTDEYKF